MNCPPLLLKVFFIYPIISGISFSCNAQEWQTVTYFENIPDNHRVLELFPDTISNKLYIGGSFKNINNIETRNITAFDGFQFESISPEINTCWNLGCQGVYSITRYKGDIIASSIRSSTYEADPQIIGIGRWDGDSWHPLDGGASDYYNSIVQQYDPAILADFCIANDMLYVAGYIKYVDSLAARGMAAWDGVQWTTFNVPPPPQGAGILATSVAKYKGEIYLGGNFDANINGTYAHDLIKYDGTAWHPVGDGLVNGWTNMHDLEVFQDKLIVAGYFTQADGNPGNSIMSWDGEHWNDMGGGICTPFGAIDDLFVQGGKLYVAGAFDCIGGIEAHNVAVWDGSKWCSIGQSVFDKPVHAIAVWRDTVYVGGSFLKIDSQPARFFARYVGDHSTDVCSVPVSVQTEPLTTSALRLYPNPAEDRMQLQLDGGEMLPNSLRVFNASGKEVSSLTDVVLNAQTAILQTGRLAPGLYFLQVGMGDGRVWNGRFVKR